MAYVWTVSDKDQQYLPKDNDELFRRLKEIGDLIPQPEQKELDNNIRFAQKAFALLKDCGFISKENVEALNDPDWCYENFNSIKITTLAKNDFKMNPLGGVLRRDGLTMWDSGLRYYCPFEELKVASDIEIALTKERKGATKLAVICEGTTYYISNDWYSNDHPRYTKTAFVIWLILWTMQTCEMAWAEQRENGNVESNDEPAPQKVDMETILQSLQELHKKVDELNEKITFLYEELK